MVGVFLPGNNRPPARLRNNHMPLPGPAASPNLGAMTNGDGNNKEQFYRAHVFCCTNERPDGHPRGSCAGRGSVKLRNYFKARAKELGLERVRINSAGCLERCEQGPAIVIYPEGVWYKAENFEDIDEILQKHLVEGGRARRLLMDSKSGPDRTDCADVDDKGCADCGGC